MASPGVNRMLYCFMGDDVRVDGTRVQAKVGARLDASRPVSLESQGGPAGFLLLQGRPDRRSGSSIGALCHELAGGTASGRRRLPTYQLRRLDLEST